MKLLKEIGLSDILIFIGLSAVGCGLFLLFNLGKFLVIQGSIVLILGILCVLLETFSKKGP